MLLCVFLAALECIKVVSVYVRPTGCGRAQESIRRVLLFVWHGVTVIIVYNIL